MDNLGDYLYLIILVVAGLSSLLKKKKTAEVAQPEYEQPDSNWGVEEDDSVPQFNMTQSQTPVARMYKADAPVSTYETVEDVAVLRAKKQVFSTITTMKRPFNEEVNIDDADQEFLKSVAISNIADAKKAFVYSEIFNRKY